MPRRAITWLACTALALTLGACGPAGPDPWGSGETTSVRTARALTAAELEDAMVTSQDVGKEWALTSPSTPITDGPSAIQGSGTMPAAPVSTTGAVEDARLVATPTGSDICDSYDPPGDHGETARTRREFSRSGAGMVVQAHAYPDVATAKVAYGAAATPLRTCREFTGSSQMTVELRAEPVIGEESTSAVLTTRGSHPMTMSMRVVRQGTTLTMVVAYASDGSTTNDRQVTERQAEKLRDAQR